MEKRILVEASGSLVSGWMIKAIKANGDIAVASDITEDCTGRFLADEFIVVPGFRDAHLWEILEKALVKNKIDVVIPSLDETLHLWAEKKESLKNKYDIRVVISDKKTIEIFQDKYKTHLFFKENQIPAPEAALTYEYPLVKPRFGRGSQGIILNPDPETVNMEGMISQEYLSGQEYTVDCFFDHQGEPVYIVPRKRVLVKDGKAVNGVVTSHPKITQYVKKISKAVKFYGPINIQCFDTESGVKFIEVNPRIGGGMALGLAATENWIHLITDYLLAEKQIEKPKAIKYGLRMFRYYDEVFV